MFQLKIVYPQNIIFINILNHAYQIQSLKRKLVFRSLTTQQIPFSTNDLAVLICNSNVRHELSDSEYPTRRKQCAEALRLMDLQTFRNAKLENLAGNWANNYVYSLLYRINNNSWLIAHERVGMENHSKFCLNFIKNFYLL